MVFNLVGLGLGDAKDITVKGLELVKNSTVVLLEAYTAIFCDISCEELSKFYGKEVQLADRETVEQGLEKYILQAKTEDITLLVVGDPFAATTHTDLFTRCRKLGIPVQVVHNASIMNAIGCCGLQLYNYGRTVSIVFFTESWRPDSFYDKIKSNIKAKLHTLLLLDIKVKEQSVENMIKGKLIYEPPRYMTINQCIEQLLEVEEKRGEGLCGPESPAVGVARVGHDTQQIVYGTLKELLTVDFGGPLHSLALVGETDLIEQEMLDLYKFPESTVKNPFNTPESEVVTAMLSATITTTPAAPTNAESVDLQTSAAAIKWAKPPTTYITYDDDASFGKTAPSLQSALPVKGNPVDVDTGKVTVVSFFAKFAKGDYTTVVALSELVACFKPSEVEFVGISIDPAIEDVQSFVKKIGSSLPEIYVDELVVSYPLMFDDGKEIKEAYRKLSSLLSLGASAVFVVDTKGTIVWREQFGQGHTPSQGQLGEQIRRVVNGEALLKNGDKPVADVGDDDENSDEDVDPSQVDYDYDSDLGF